MTQHLESTVAHATAARLDEAKCLMDAFAQRTGLVAGAGGESRRRYLWTDAFAVCNLLGLASRTGQERYAQLALRLVDRVHEVLGRHRPDSGQTGWLSGLDERHGRNHPTRGGLRIGKPLPERGPEEPFDDRLEWERDGQYFHYLTRWMHALDQVGRFTGRAHYNRWARELADVAHAAFTRPTRGHGVRMSWKMSCDLSRVQVSSMGQHDPLDGLVTALELQSTARTMSEGVQPPLERAVADYASMLDLRRLATADPLGIGGLLLDAARLEQMGPPPGSALEQLLDAILAACVMGLDHLASTDWLQEPAERRLAFRELGLAIGLAAVGELDHHDRTADWSQLARFVPIADRIRGFWLDRDHRCSEAFVDHLDISEVMLASSLVPDALVRMAQL